VKLAGKNNVTCVYCSQARAVTTEHVVAKSFFPRPRPSNLWTTPACRECNSGIQKDEDYFLATLMFGPAGVSAVGKRLWERLERGYEKDRGLRKVIARNLRETDVRTPAGLVITKQMTISVDQKRIERVTGKIVRGLYYCEFSEPLRHDVEIESAMFAPFADARSRFPIVLEEGARSWPGIFQYTRGRLPGEPHRSLWRFRMFDAHEFFAITGGDLEVVRSTA
jgi:hypothetical protein